MNQEKSRDVTGNAEGAQNQLAKKLKSQGFDGVQALGGDLWVGLEDLELLHRGFIYAPPANKESRFEKAAKWLLAFGDLEKDVKAESWVPDSVASYSSFRWNFEDGIQGIGLLVDDFLGAGRWKTLVQGFKTGRQGTKFDIYGAAKRMDGKITIISEYKEPFNEDSEKIVAALKLKPKNAKFASDALNTLFKNKKKYWGKKTQGRLVYWVSKEVVDQTSDLDDLGDDDLSDLPGGEGVEPTKAPPAPKPLFKKKVLVVHNDTLFFSNDLEYLQSVIKKRSNGALNKKADWKKVSEKMDKLSPKADCFRQFGRISKRLQLFYELLRQNKVPRDNGLFSRALGKLKDNPKQLKKLDGKNLPENYQEAVAPYLGLGGLSLENREDGWFLLNCVIPKDK